MLLCRAGVPLPSGTSPCGPPVACVGRGRTIFGAEGAGNGPHDRRRPGVADLEVGRRPVGMHVQLQVHGQAGRYQTEDGAIVRRWPPHASKVDEERYRPDRPLVSRISVTPPPRVRLMLQKLRHLGFGSRSRGRRGRDRHGRTVAVPLGMRKTCRDLETHHV